MLYGVHIERLRSKRRVIGKIDPATGDVVPTGKRGRKGKEPSDKEKDKIPAPVSTAADTATREQLLHMELTISSLKARISVLEEENRQYKLAMEKTASLAARISAVCRSEQSNS